jgi:DNA-binding NtrC family response regulator
LGDKEPLLPSGLILWVDDEGKVLTGLVRSLLEEDLGEIKTALNASEALEIIKRTPNLAAVVSDYRMPGMNGIDFLVEVRGLAADASRILLTGAADLETAIKAVNRCNLFRFLLKPCPQEVFITAVKDGIRQNQSISGERELLNSGGRSKIRHGAVPGCL